MAELTVKLNGVLWKKAELDKDFIRVYTKVLEKMIEMENLEFDFLEILGDIGG